MVEKNSFCFNGCLSDSLTERTWIFEISVNNTDDNDNSNELSATRNLSSAANFKVMSVIDGKNLHEISG